MFKQCVNAILRNTTQEKNEALRLFRTTVVYITGIITALAIMNNPMMNSILLTRCFIAYYFRRNSVMRKMMMAPNMI